eukprot:4848588-Alexandrium_andersonii.AAC.1
MASGEGASACKASAISAALSFKSCVAWSGAWRAHTRTHMWTCHVEAVPGATGVSFRRLARGTLQARSLAALHACEFDFRA